MNTDLWNKLEHFKIAPNAKFSFEKRLARENNWSPKFANRVVAGYKKFIYLAATSSKEVTPSDEVDQAWHLHMTYTSSYSEDLCDKVLGFPLHHNPTKGGGTEQDRFWDQYTDTLDFYEATFGERPPADVWPPPEDRFRSVDSFVRINRDDVWTISKPDTFARQWPWVLVFAAIFASGAVFAGGASQEYLFWKILAAVLAIYCFMWFVLWLLDGLSSRSSQNNGGCGGGGCGGSGCGGGGCDG